MITWSRETLSRNEMESVNTMIRRSSMLKRNKTERLISIEELKIQDLYYGSHEKKNIEMVKSNS